MAIVYEHYRKDTNEIFYVGIGKIISRSKSKSNRNPHWLSIVKNYGYDIKITHENITWKEACEIEVTKIKEYGRRDLDLGPLVNLTDGGEGIPNLSLKSKRILSEGKKGIKNPQFGKFGVEIHNSKLSQEDANLIREIFVPFSREFGVRALSKKFKVDRQTIKKIVQGKSYKKTDGLIAQNLKQLLINGKTNDKFTSEDIKYIRKVYLPHHPEFGPKPLSIKFNTNETRIWKIATYKVWKNI
jgi:hypothetical protein